MEGFNAEKVIQVFWILDRESSSESIKSLLEKARIVACDKYVVDINQDVYERRVTVDLMRYGFRLTCNEVTSGSPRV